MNYHIVIDDKFIDSIIQDIEDIGELHNNIFWLREKNKNVKYVTNIDKVEFIGTKEDLENKISSIKPDDTIVVHWYDSYVARVIMHTSNKLIVFFWGGEMYEIPFWHHIRWLFDKKTLKYVISINTPKVKIFKSLKKTLRSIITRIQYFIKVPNDSNNYYSRLEEVRRIDILVVLNENKKEVELIRSLYPGTRFKHKPGFYDLNFDLSAQYKNKINNKKLQILLGNSATETNNHLDAFKLLSQLDVEIFCPLSYGADEYKSLVISEGHKKFKKRFHPVDHFMNRTDYVEFINSMDIIVMNHNRSQAFGNIVISLTLGKPIFLKRKNPIWDLIESFGLNCYDIKKIKEYDLKKLCKIEYEKRQQNIEQLRFFLSKERRLNDLRMLLT